MRKFTLLLISVLVLAVVQVPAQTFISAPVDVSGDKVRTGGKLFYVHKVLEGQTLTAIAQAYGLTADELKSYNAAASSGLRAGSILYIPVEPAAPAAAGEPAVGTPSASDTSRAEEAPAAVRSRSSVPRAAAAAVQDRKFRKHTARWYETLQDVAEYYKIPVEALAALNGMQVTDALQRRQVLLIPDGKYVEAFRAGSAAGASAENTCPGPDGGAAAAAGGAAAAGDAAAVDGGAGAAAAAAGELPQAQNDNTVVVDEPADVSDAPSEVDAAVTYAACDPLTYDRWADTYTVTLVLPMGASGRQTAADAGMMDFYSGALLAFDELRKDRSYDKYTLRVIDLKEWPSVQKMLSESGIEKSDIIIGPVSEEDMAPVAAFAAEKRIPTISPLDGRTGPLSGDNPYLFVFPVPSDVVNASLIEDFTRDAEDDALTVIYETGTEAKPLVSGSLAVLDSAGVNYNSFHYGILQGRNVEGGLLSRTDTTRLNRILVPSENEAFVADVLRNLNVLSNSGVRFSVYGFPKWRSFESVELANLHTLNTHISLGYYVDYEDSKVKDFLGHYGEVFHTSATPYAFQGYDVVRYFVTSLEEYGAVFPVKISGRTSQLLQSDVRFTPCSPSGGFRNEAVRKVVYRPAWTIEYVRQ